MAYTFDIRSELRNRVPQSMAALLARLAISRPTLAQRLNSDPAIVRLGRAQRTRYALRIAEPVSIYRVDEHGRLAMDGILTELSTGWFFDATDKSPFLQGDFRDGYFPDLPWFVQDVRPQGFLGRSFAKRHAKDLGLQEDPERWTSAQLLHALSVHGDDLPGNILISQTAAERFIQNRNYPITPILLNERASAYAASADNALQAGHAGSSAAGEQPKFTAALRTPDAEVIHVIVKFSPSTDSAEAQRWRDLLRCEHWAAEALRESGLGAAKSEIIEADSRVFLQSTRHDRIGANGRRRQFSLGAFDDAYFGRRDNWFDAATRLHAGQWLSESDAQRLQSLYVFGLAIRNSDMHFGNISLIEGRSAPLALAPTYDMLPMQFRPNVLGEISTGTLPPALILPEHEDAYSVALPAIHAFRERFMADSRITASFKQQLNRSLAI